MADEPLRKSVVTLTTLLDMAAETWWKRLCARRLIADASDELKSLDRQMRGERKKAQEQIAESRKAAKDAKGIYQRTLLAIEELEKGKSPFKFERAVAVVLSPYQYGQLTMHGDCPCRKLRGLDILIAKGVYGPVVLTQDGLNGFTRSAPELNIRMVGPSNG